MYNAGTHTESGSAIANLDLMLYYPVLYYKNKQLTDSNTNLSPLF